MNNWVFAVWGAGVVFLVWFIAFYLPKEIDKINNKGKKTKEQIIIDKMKRYA